MSTTIKRVGTIDGIRGWSLFGILLANLLIFQYGIFGKDEIGYFNLSSTNLGFYYFTKIFIEGAFMPIFTFIFGYSLILMKKSLERKQLRVKWHLFRRSIILMGLGLLHSTFLWEGDILLMYGIMGICLLPFVMRKPKTILIWVVILFSLITAVSLVDSDGDFKLTSEAKMTSYLNETMTIYSSGTYSEIKDHRLNKDPMELGVGEGAVMLLLLPLLLSPMFLFGMYAAQMKWFLNPIKEKRNYLAGLLILIPIGLLLKSTPYLFDELNMEPLGGIVLPIGYICLVAFAYSKFPRALTVFENVGKLSLTNYILQTVICTFIFYGYGFGLFAKLGVAAGVVLGVVIFTCQIVVSTLYLRYFKQGPLERLIRIGVYLRLRGAQ
ncbi:DUF418 domain-containing protein [Sporosarcina sp. BI001-red]|uniref:DUF418 domain-containing protein n=1 Tax=Sporosarcina sp. BI001-red TaxID=2282866 RepID=UPI000E25DA16|nr:DUF418 domain-containing protein [Sporosarcina sp. BI001-red]REB11628.1 DUF418 domain-containing protein [Sporosarcina sp. BI001-red]